MKKFLALVVLVLVLISCDEENEAPMRDIFTYKTIGWSGSSNHWIVVRSYETGELLDAQEINSDKTEHVFKSNKDIPNDKLSITYFHISETQTAYAEVYNAVDVGTVTGTTTFDYELDNTTPGAQIGTYNLVVNDVPSFSGFSISDKFGTWPSDVVLDDDVFSGKVKILEGATEHFVSINTRDGKPRYIFIPEVHDGDDVEISYNDFLEFDSYLTITFPLNERVYGFNTAHEARASVAAWTLYGNGYALDNERTSLSLGFLDRFDVYEISLSLNSDFMYRKRGSKPTSIDYVGSDQFNITDNSISGYTVETAQPYKFREVRYDNFSTASARKISITYHDPYIVTRHNDAFSPELIEKFSLPVSELVHGGSYFYVKGQSWEQHLNEFLNTMPTPYEKEEVFVTVGAQVPL